MEVLVRRPALAQALAPWQAALAGLAEALAGYAGSALAGSGRHGRLWQGVAGCGRLCLAGSGRLWQGLAVWQAQALPSAGSGRLCQALAGPGRLWQALAGSGRLWQALAGSGRLWQALAGSQALKSPPPAGLFCFWESLGFLSGLRVL